MFLTRNDEGSRMEATLINGGDGPAGIELQEEPLEDGVVLTVRGELDIATVPGLRERLDAAVDAGVGRLVLDLTGVTFMDSVAMAAIIHARTRLGDAGRLAVVIAGDSYPRLVLEIAGLPRCLDLFETRAEAVAA